MPLFLVSTPIGNLGDMSPRAVTALKEAEVIAAEDTRRTGLLLHHFGISGRMVSCHDHNEGVRARELLPLLLQGKNVAVVTDAGTPGIADPAFDLIRAAIENKVTVVPVPGASAVLAALCASGLPTDRFVFENFLPVKPGKRRHRLLELKNETRTVVLFESPFRLVRTLKDIRDVLGDVYLVAAREITKMHETFVRGRAGELAAYFEKNGVKGEITLCFNLTFEPGRAASHAAE